MKCIYNEEYKNHKIKIYFIDYNYYYKLRFPNERKYYFTDGCGYDLKIDALKCAKEYIDCLIR